MILQLDTTALPPVSVILPVRNEARYIARSLAAVVSQDYPTGLMEIIVADGMSTDNTREVVKSFAAKYPNLRLVDNPGQIVSTGLNIGIAWASGEVLIRVDGHCQIESDYLSRCIEHLKNDGVDCVGGSIETVGETNAARVIAAAMSSSFGVGDSVFRTVRNETMPADTVPFPAYTRSIIERVGVYDEELVRNQDDDYNYRLRRAGGKILLAADVRSRYFSRGSLVSLCRQYYQYGYWKVRVLQKNPRQMRPRQFIPPFFVASLLVSLLSSPFFDIGRMVFRLVACSYLVANISASLLTAHRSDWRLFRQLPIAFAIIHIAYGIGFLVGLIRFWNRWGDRESRGSFRLSKQWDSELRNR